MRAPVYSEFISAPMRTNRSALPLRKRQDIKQTSLYASSIALNAMAKREGKSTRGRRRHAGQSQGPLTARQLGELARKALENALALLAEAEGLERFGRHARAMSLCILAEEEFGKHMMAMGGLGRRPEDTAFWNDFWRRFRKHEPKYENALHLTLRFLDSDARKAFLEDFEAHMTVDLDRKMSGLYVEVRDGEVISPDEAISSETVRRSLSVAGMVIRSWADLHAGVDFVSSFEQAESDARVMQEALASGDPERIAGAWEQTTTPRSPS